MQTQEFIVRITFDVDRGIEELLKCASDRRTVDLVQAEYSDLALAYTRLGRLIDHLSRQRGTTYAPIAEAEE